MMKRGCTAGNAERGMRRLFLWLARYLIRFGTRLRKRVTTDMNLSEYLAQFGDTMATANHGSSWGVAGATFTTEGITKEGRIFAFVSVEPDRVARAESVLGAAGLLCETPLRREGDAVVTETLTVHGLTVGLRALMGGGRNAR